MKSLWSKEVSCTAVPVPMEAHFACFPYWPVVLRVQVESLFDKKKSENGNYEHCSVDYIMYAFNTFIFVQVREGRLV